MRLTSYLGDLVRYAPNQILTLHSPDLAGEYSSQMVLGCEIIAKLDTPRDLFTWQAFQEVKGVRYHDTHPRRLEHHDLHRQGTAP